VAGAIEIDIYGFPLVNLRKGQRSYHGQAVIQVGLKDRFPIAVIFAVMEKFGLSGIKLQTRAQTLVEFIQQLVLICTKFLEGVHSPKESILLLFNPLLDPAKVALQQSPCITYR
jgi:hypothetical protein